MDKRFLNENKNDVKMNKYFYEKRNILARNVLDLIVIGRAR